MRKAVLEDAKPYEVAIGAVPTTILMPAPIEAFEGNNITTKPDTVANVFLAARAGHAVFQRQVASAGRGRPERHPRRFGLQLPVLLFGKQSHADLDPRPGEAPRSRVPEGSVRITARRLYDILQDAKTYFVVKEQHPELERTIQVAAPGKVLEYPGYRIVIDQVFRFDRDDTLVFRVIFLNDTEAPLYYRPGEIALRVGRNLYWPSFAQVQPGHPAARAGAAYLGGFARCRFPGNRQPEGPESLAPRPALGAALRSGRVCRDRPGKNGHTDSLKFRVAVPGAGGRARSPRRLQGRPRISGFGGSS